MPDEYKVIWKDVNSSSPSCLSDEFYEGSFIWDYPGQQENKDDWGWFIDCSWDWLAVYCGMSV